jgi:hypothetical protein
VVAAALDKAPADIDGVWDDDVFEVFLDQVLDQDLDQGSILTLATGMEETSSRGKAGAEPLAAGNEQLARHRLRATS